MRQHLRFMAVAAAGATVAAAIVLITANGSRAAAQTPPAPCVCSRATPIVGTDELLNVPGQIQARFGVVHCQCGAATCVSQIPFAAGIAHQLYCVK